MLAKKLELYMAKPGDLTIKEYQPVQEIGDNEVKLEVIYGGICGSDLSVYKGKLPYAQFPCRPGHEILGTVIAAGKNAPYKVGTKVASFPNTYCGECEFCRQGKTNICKNKKSFGVTINGLFAQEIVIDAEFVVPVPAGLPDERAVLAEPFAVIVHALKKVSVSPGMSAAVVGCGTEGSLAAALLLHRGADLTVMDVNPVKMQIAQSLGKNVKTLHPNDVKDEMFDVVVEAAGTKASVEQAFQLVKPGGTMIGVGITSENISYPAIRITRSEITIHGSIIYVKKDFEDAFALLSKPDFKVDPVISKIVPLAAYHQAFSDALSGNFVKVVLDFKQT